MRLTELIAENVGLYRANIVLISAVFLVLSMGFLVFGIKLFSIVHESASRRREIAGSSGGMAVKARKVCVCNWLHRLGLRCYT